MKQSRGPPRRVGRPIAIEILDLPSFTSLPLSRFLASLLSPGYPRLGKGGALCPASGHGDGGVEHGRRWKHPAKRHRLSWSRPAGAAGSARPTPPTPPRTAPTRPCVKKRYAHLHTVGRDHLNFPGHVDGTGAPLPPVDTILLAQIPSKTRVANMSENHVGTSGRGKVCWKGEASVPPCSSGPMCQMTLTGPRKTMSIYIPTGP